MNSEGDNLYSIPNLDQWIGDRELRIIEGSLHGLASQPGKNPALVVIDAQLGFVGTDTDIEESIVTFPKSVGEAGWRAVEKIKRLVETARKNELTIIFTRLHLDKKSRSYTSFGSKTDLPEERGFNIVDDLQPSDEDIVIDKFAASGFFGTHLSSVLTTKRIDTLVIAGFTTSGCVRATAVDAASYNYHVVIVADAVADRLEISHVVSLLDIQTRYGNVISADDAEAYLREVTPE